jgi:ubiquinone/menaquinone biosynthesis C-methylase UbiE
MSLVSMIIADRMESLTKYYDRWMSLITGGQDKRVRDAVLGYIEPGDLVLDVGCGTGTLAVKAAQKGAQVIGVDQAPAMLKLAREKAQASGIEVDFRLAQAQSLDLEKKFDAMTATFTLSEISPDEAKMIVADLAEHLKPDGKIIVADEARPAKALQRVVSELQRAIVALLTFLIIKERPTRLHDLRALLEATGLAVTDEQFFQGGALRLVVAERRGMVVKPRREILEPIIHGGPKGFLWDFLCWLFILPLAVRSGLYRIGNPSRDSPLLLTCNFYMTFKQVVKALQGRHCWLLVQDTEGWNVWCAADARIFSAEKAVALMRSYDAIYDGDSLLNHKTIVVPRLGGRIARRLSELTALRPGLRRAQSSRSGQGWRVIKGPIEARDLPAFIEGGLVTTPQMRSLRRYYGLPQRLRVGTLTALIAILCTLPFLFILREFLPFFLAFGLASSFVLGIFHYWIPGRTGVVKELLLGALAFVGLLGRIVVRGQPVTLRLGWAILALLIYSFVLGYMYQGSTPVIYWKRVWK